MTENAEFKPPQGNQPGENRSPEIEPENRSDPYPAGQNKPCDANKILISQTGEIFDISLDGETISINQDSLESIKNGNLDPGMDAKLQLHNIDQDNFIKKLELFDSEFSISEPHNIHGHVRNGNKGFVEYITITWEYKKDKNTGKKSTDLEPIKHPDVVCLFSGDLKPIMIDHVPSIEVNFPDGRLITGSVNEIVKIFKSEYHLTPAKMQRLREVFDAWFRFQLDHSNVEDRNRSPIFIQDGIVRCSYDVDKMSFEDSIRAIREFLPHAKVPRHFQESLSWALFAPLHYEMKTRATRLIQAPNVFTSGASGAGKTSNGDLLLGHGFAQSRDQYYFSFNRVKTLYSLTWNLSLSNLPCLIDDVPADFFIKNAENLKSYCQTGIFGDRGKGDPGVNQYRGMRSFITTTNDSQRIDDDIALSNRNLLEYFTVQALTIKNRNEWKKLYSTLPEGFMFALFDVIFGGMAIENIVQDAENFESSHDWIRYVLEKINMLCAWYGIDEFPELTTSERPETDNASEIAEAFVSEWGRIQRGKDDIPDMDGKTMVKTNYRSLVDGELRVDDYEDKWMIYFTGASYKLLNQVRRLNLPYKTASEFLNNISPNSAVKAENEGRLKNIWIVSQSVKCFSISLRRDGNDDDA
ncbi:MAG: hypothetical protein ACYDAP_03610 [Thermoplasmataceae archaeon]